MRVNHETNDPAGWVNCSYSAHPMDELEPEPEVQNAYREAARKHRQIDFITDSFMSRQKNGVRAWIVVSIVLCYPSTRGRTLTSIANEMGVTKQALSRSVTHFSRMLGIEPAFGLKSIASRQKYGLTNGRNGH